MFPACVQNTNVRDHGGGELLPRLSDLPRRPPLGNDVAHVTAIRSGEEAGGVCDIIATCILIQTVTLLGNQQQHLVTSVSSNSSAPTTSSIIGQRFGKLLVLRLERTEKYRRHWRLICDCGAEKVCREDLLRDGRAHSCHACIMQLRADGRPPWKRCPACEESKPREQFNSDRTTSDKLAGYCRKCASKKSRELRSRYLSRSHSEILHASFKRCQKCGVDRPSEDYWRDMSRSDGLSNRCRECQSEYHRAYHDRTKDKHRERRCLRSRVNRHGVTEERFYTMLIGQDKACSICRKPFAVMRHCHIDHNHKTGQIRALLCSTCNTGLGQFREDKALLEAAINYLTHWAD